MMSTGKRLSYHAAFYLIIALGLALLGVTYGKLYEQPPEADLKQLTALGGYTVVVSGVLICLLIALLRWRSAEDDDGRRPSFRAGVGVLAMGVALMIASIMR